MPDEQEGRLGKWESWVDERPRLGVVVETLQEFFKDEAPLRAAALAFFSLFAIAPLFIVVLALSGFLLGSEEVARSALFGGARSLLGGEESEAIQTVVDASQVRSGGVFASLVGFVVLLFGASRVFAYLERSLNLIWDVKPKEKPNVSRLVRKRIFSFTMVLGVGFLLLVSLILTSLIASGVAFLEPYVPGGPLVWTVTKAVVSVLVLTAIFAALFKYLPDARIHWRDVLVGAFATAVLFAVGQAGIAVYLAQSALASAYGAAGSIVVVLLWLYYASLIFLLGAELTQVYAKRLGDDIHPEEDIARKEGRKDGGARERRGARGG